MGALKAQSFANRLGGKPAVIVTMREWLNHFKLAAKGDTGYVEMYATEPVGTEVWLRYEIIYRSHAHDTGQSRWQCLARVTASKCVQRGTAGTFPKFRTTFVLIGDPEETRPPGY